jgi:putative flippase GtrA
VIATFANLGAQRFILSATGGWYFAALMAGTLVGLVVKYRLDKRWIFFDDRRDLRSETRIFGLYTLTGVGTTFLFWGCETLFWLVGQTEIMREMGAALGLTFGYVIKYKLDYRFVFPKTDAAFEDRSNGQSE